MSAHTDGYLGEMTLPLKVFMRLLEEREEMSAIVRDLAGVYTVETDQFTVLSLVQRARAVVSQHEEQRS